MELPSYSRQLMQQLQALRKEGRFCDCTILLEGASHPAHKVVLAASSLLFKSLFESSDSISIDTAVVTSKEFSSLLDMVYMGRLPPGKHNFTRVITAADSLQMFDVAVGCKNILNDLVKQAQPKDPQPLKQEHTDLQTSTTELGLSESCGDLALEEGDSSGRSENVVKSSEERSGFDDLKEEKKGSSRGEWPSVDEEGAGELLSQRRDEILKALQVIQPWVKGLRAWEALPTALRQIILECFEGDGVAEVVFQRLLDGMKDERNFSAQTLLTLLDQMKILNFDLGVKMVDRSGPELQRNSAAMPSRSLGFPGKDASKLTDYLNGVNNVSEMLAQAADKCEKEAVKEVLLECKREQSRVQVVKRLMSMLLERGIEENAVLELLQETGESLREPPKGPRNTAESAAPSQAAGSEEEEREQPALRRKGVVVSYSCQWCSKSFDFKCRLVKHRKRCALSPGKAQHCADCPLGFPTLTALQHHCSEAHGAPPAKKKKAQPVACELCSRTFKHPSGLLYHRRTEHLEERPYACEDCGAKFAANSSLKNHMRLHTGEKPYQCKHCDMSFAVAAALSYHTKKKHAEGKMYSCQYCSSAFAQSIELTRHVRTHTGDKPYVCRECGKGFRQANGLSVHLQSFHNVAEPHDCQKCRVSFGSLDELRDHIQEVHPKELHQCPECSRIFSTAAQLEKHMSVHDGSKPYSCVSCHKSYQTLSGLWYHNRTTHPDMVTAEGSRSVSPLLRCKTCDKAFCNRSSLFKHQITKHPETRSAAGGWGEKEAEAEGPRWKCVYCACTASSEEALQQHVSSEHLSQQGSEFGCVVCSLTFPSEAEFQHHFLSTHLQAVQEEDPIQMVIHTPDTSAAGAEQMAELDRSQVDCSQQVFVALGDGGGAAAGPEIVAVNMEDLLAGRVTLICEENS